MLIRARGSAAVAAALALTLAATPPARAGLVFVSDRATLAGNDHVDWSTLGAPGAVVSTPHAATSQGGLGVTVDAANTFSNPHSPVTIGTLGGLPDLENDWDFSNPFNPVHFTADNEIRLTFAQAVSGAGAEVFSSVVQNGPPTATVFLKVFDTTGAQIGQTSYTAFGTVDQFVGVRSDTADIGSILFQVQTGTNSALTHQYFHVNQLDLVTGQAGPSPVPAPPAVALLGTAAVSLLGYSWRRRKG